MKTVEKGHYVKVCYTGKFEDGEVFDHSESCKPLEVQVGAGEVIKGFESALVGMALNEKKTFTLSPEEAYGQRDEKLEHTFMRSDIPTDFDPQVGEVVALQSERGDQTLASVKHTDNEKIVVDLNHPLAGKTLVFEVEIAEINDKPSPSQSMCESGCCCS